MNVPLCYGVASYTNRETVELNKVEQFGWQDHVVQTEVLAASPFSLNPGDTTLEHEELWSSQI
jgi:hypothetical protein